MILTTILLIILAILAVSAIFIISVGGAAFIVVFADVIVCMAIIIGILKMLFKRKKK